MSGALCTIGGALLEVIGLNPQEIEWGGEAHWPDQAVFGAEAYVQPTGLGPETVRLKLAARPHVMGGLAAIAILQAHFRAQDVVPYIRLGAGLSAEIVPAAGIRRMGRVETRIAPDGIGRRQEVDVELIILGAQAGGF